MGNPERLEVAMDRESLIDYLHLALTGGVGSTLLRRLLDHFGSAAAVLTASPVELSEVPGIGLVLSRNLRSLEARAFADQTYEICQENGIQILLPDSDDFPRLLNEIPDPPNLLFVRGQLKTSDSLSIAIVGTRTASQYGRAQAARFSRGLAQAGLTIVSGLARGIDGAAHQAAMEASGRTIAVLSSGVLDVFPPQHTELANQIAEHGALISEMPPGSKPMRGMFPRRNRLISGLCLATIVIEAAERSGALITARTAGEQGREVFAMPGLVSSPNARGCHRLIRDGAILIQDPEDVLEALGPLVAQVQISQEQTVRHPGELTLNEQETAVLQAIATEPTSIDTVIVCSGLPVPRVLSTLSVLEMRRLVRRVSGTVVQRT
ncbi:MAG TPA: DNA-protecting protein DprA [Planctomycetaceae bacterium]|nr:DNA-protecting protein DprA [Planctomycetaceae bacterium]